MQNIKSHTALRGIAAICVVYGHYAAVFARDIGGYDFFIDRGYLGVDFFFLLSGFILTMVYAHSFADGVTPRLWGQFLQRRLARIYPLHVVTLLAVVVLLRFKVPATDFGIFGLNLGLVQAWGFTDRFLFNAPSWSISCEFAAYLVFPFLMVALRHRFAPGVMLGGAALAYAMLWRLGGGSLDLDAIGRDHAMLRVVAAFPIGMLLALASKRVRLQQPGAINLMQGAALIGFFAAVWLGMPDIVLVLPLAAIIFLTVPQSGFLSRMLGDKRLTLLGDLSYGIYLIQWPVMLLMYNLRPKLEPFVQGPMLEIAALVIFLVILMALSFASFHGFEKPIMRWARQERSDRGEFGLNR